MRLSFAIAVSIATLGVTAADAGERYAARPGYYPSYVVRAPVYVLYEEPAEFRSYWERPWNGRHYYPFTGRKPKVGRHGDLNAPRRVVKPAPSYYQEWSTLSLYPPRAVMPPADVAVAPDMK